MQPAALAARSNSVMQQEALAACIIFKYLHAAQSGGMQLEAWHLSLGHMLGYTSCVILEFLWNQQMVTFIIQNFFMIAFSLKILDTCGKCDIANGR